MVKTLAELEPGQCATVRGFSETGPLIQRIMQLGVIENSEIELVRKAPGGDPIEIHVLGYSLSLRRREAEMILIDLN